MNSVWELEFERQMQAVMDGRASSADLHRLDDLLAENPAAMDAYIALIKVDALLRWRSGLGQRGCQRGLAAIAAAPHIIQTPSPPRLPLLGNTIQSTVSYLSSGWPVAYLAATVIFGIGLLIGSHVYVSQPVQVARQSSLPSRVVAEPKMESVGRITGMVDCQWMENPKSEIRNPNEIENQKSEIRNQKSLVSLGDKFALASGLMEITYDTGAKVILQGPVTYEVESASGGYLSLGKLTARVDKKGLGFSGQGSEISKTQDPRPKTQDPSPNPLFAVRTPTATVTDLGTEFGVEVSPEGQTTSHVFRGSVRLQVASADGKAEGPVQVLHENESIQTERSHGPGGPRIVVRQVSVDPKSFVRHTIQPLKMLDLLDIVTGGNGTGRGREHGIDPTTGMEDASYWAATRTSDGTYSRVAWSKLIDGVFVPRANKGAPVTLDSAGHTFQGFPPTSGWSYGSIWARAAAVPKNDLVDNGAYGCYAMGRCEQFMPEGRGLLYLQPNVGITFDLQTVRQMYVGARPARFRAVAGLRACRGYSYFDPQRDDIVNFWIFIDGRLALNRMDYRPKDAAIPVSIGLGPNDRFLTLVTINNRGAGWFVFGDPVLEMVALDPNGGKEVNGKHP